MKKVKFSLKSVIFCPKNGKIAYSNIIVLIGVNWGSSPDDDTDFFKFHIFSSKLVKKVAEQLEKLKKQQISLKSVIFCPKMAKYEIFMLDYSWVSFP